MLDRSKTAQYKLTAVKELIVSGKRYFCDTRGKNRETLKQLGLDTDGAFKEIMKLKPSDFSGVDSEPGKIDADVYRRKIQGMDVYIKFKIEIRPENKLVVVSFHQNEQGV